MISKVVLATNNAGKIREFGAILAKLEIDSVSQSTFNIPDAEETGLSFVENAILKARNAAQHTGLAALADDSGLVVDALNGAPGIYSARYASPNTNDHANIDKLLKNLQGVATHQRTARFVCALALLCHATDPIPLICLEMWEGLITERPQGHLGFGYDPVFFVPEENCTAAQLDMDTKNRLSHRGRALVKLQRCLANKPDLGY